MIIVRSFDTVFRCFINTMFSTSDSPDSTNWARVLSGHEMRAYALVTSVSIRFAVSMP